MTLTFDPAKRQHYNRLVAANVTRDSRHQMIHAVRNGHMRQLFPEQLIFDLTFEGVPVANFVDIVARDMAEAIAPLPALACTSGKMETQADLERAARKNRIGDNYWRHSKLESQMLRAADRYITYGFLPVFIEPDFQNKLPYMHLEDPRNAYYELDRFGRPVTYAKRWLRSCDELTAQFPEYSNIIQPEGCKGETQLRVVRWVDKTHVTLFLPDRDALVLSRYEHKLSRLPVWIAERPGESDNPRGQFDDVIWVQVARAIMGTLALEAASKAVQAPIAVPEDMEEFPVGPNAILQSKDAKDIHRVNLELPPAIFAENQTLDQEMKLGSRYPDARTGGVTASVITGKGVEALLGTFDTQIKGAQMVLREMLQQSTAICFEYDEKWFPNDTKQINGTLSGSSYTLSYTPAKDIAGRYESTVTYGFAAGMHPSQSIITMLQLNGAGLVADSTVQENLPFQIDSLQEKRKIDVEGSREALKQGLFSVIQSAGPMALQGQDPMPYLKLATDAIRATQNGLPIEEAVAAAFEQLQQAQKEEAAEQAAQQQEAQAASGGGAAPGGDNPLGFNGLPEGVAPGQAGLPPGGAPSIMQAVAGFRGNGDLPINSSVIRRNIPIGG